MRLRELSEKKHCSVSEYSQYLVNPKTHRLLTEITVKSSQKYVTSERSNLLKKSSKRK